MPQHSTKQDHRPSWQFYPTDWLGNSDLGLCSLKAQGLWVRMLCLMFFSPVRGELRRSAGDTISSKTLAKLTGETEQEIDTLINELYNNGVFSYTEDKVIYCRRMKRESERLKLKQEAGRLGGLNGKQNTKQNLAKPEVEVEVLSIYNNIISFLNKSLYFNTIIEKDFFTYALIKAYPQVNILQELKKMEAWLTANPSRLKSNYRRFINNWISKTEAGNAASEGSCGKGPGKYEEVGTEV